LRCRFQFGHFERRQVIWRGVLGRKRLSGGQNHRSRKFAGLDAPRDGFRVGEDGPGIEDRGETPPRKHVAHLIAQLVRREGSGVSHLGSVKLTWQFQNPAVITRPLQSIGFAALFVTLSRTDTMRPSLITTVPCLIGSASGAG
jgi:hypothetical protein